MEFGIFNLMGAREADKPTAQVFGEVAEQTRLAGGGDQSGDGGANEVIYLADLMPADRATAKPTDVRA